MNKLFGLTFYQKKAKMLANGTVPIYLRVTLEGQRMELSTKCCLLSEQWNVAGPEDDRLYYGS